MKSTKKILALLLAAVMCMGLFVGCGESNANDDTPLVVGYSPFSGKFSPFFSETASILPHFLTQEELSGTFVGGFTLLGLL